MARNRFFPFLLSGSLLFPAGFLSAADQVFTFDVGADALQGWTPWTNDANTVNGWQVEDGILVQTAVNEDAEAFGDRLLLEEVGTPILPESQGQAEISVDMTVMETKGGNGLWLGLILFPDSQNPKEPGAVYVIQEYAEQDGYAGLRVVSDGWSSDLASVNPALQEWHRLRIRLDQNAAGQLKVAAGYQDFATGETDWLLSVDVPGTPATNRSTIGVATSAQYGVGVNPSVAFDNLSIARDGFAVTAVAPLTQPALPKRAVLAGKVLALLKGDATALRAVSADSLDVACETRRARAAAVAAAVKQLGSGVHDSRALDAGYVLTSSRQTLPDAKALFQDLSLLDGEEGKKAEALLDWAATLEKAAAGQSSNEDVHTSFRNLASRTQGGITKTLNTDEVAASTLALAEEVSNDDANAAYAIANAIADDPAYGLLAAKARLFCAKVSGGDPQAAESLYSSEAAAYQIKMEALQANAVEDTGHALTRVNQLLETYPDTLQAADARLRKGYILLNARKYPEAEAAFKDALTSNYGLGIDHSFNLEAAARLKYIKHHELYNSTTGEPFDNPTAKEANQPLLEDVLRLNQEWLDSLPADSPDRQQALLEQAGLLFEQATYIDEHEAWENTRKVIKETVLDESEVDPSIRGIADLMTVESYFWDKQYEACITSSQEIPGKYPSNWKVIGTAKVFEYMAWTYLGSWMKAHEVMEWVRKTIPEDAPHFGKCNYHTIALIDLAVQAYAMGDRVKYTEIYNQALQKDPGSSYVRTLGKPEDLKW